MKDIALYHSTTQIISIYAEHFSAGTGFAFKFNNINGKPFSVIVTNRHVIEPSDYSMLRMRSKVDNSIIDFRVAFDKWLFHPSKDIAILPFCDICEQIQGTNLQAYIAEFNQDSIPTNEEISQMSGIEEILMVGYPDANNDVYNNMPIMRRGITATPYMYNFENMPTFLADIQSFWGSSGSPVFVFNKSTPSVYLLGIMTKSLTHKLLTSDGKSLYIPNGLGEVLKAELLLDFIPIIEHLSNVQ